MASSSRAVVLRHGNDLVLMAKASYRWLLNKILEDNFWNRELISGASPFERTDDNDNASTSQLLHQTLFVDHS